jgi:hypothetical protein
MNRSYQSISIAQIKDRNDTPAFNSNLVGMAQSHSSLSEICPFRSFGDRRPKFYFWANNGIFFSGFRETLDRNTTHGGEWSDLMLTVTSLFFLVVSVVRTMALIKK